MPNSPLPGISRFERPKTEIPLNIKTSSSSDPEIILGQLIFNGNAIDPVKIKVNDLIHHMVILGLTGYGKTILTASIIEQLVKKTGIKALIIDFKGQEYIGLFPKKVNFKYLLPGSLKFPLAINIFDPPRSVSAEDHAAFILSMIKEIMRAETTFEITPQMFRVLEDILIQFLKLKKDKNFKTFLDIFENYEVLNEFGREKLPAINATLEAIKSRFKRFIIGPLKKIFFVEKTNICWKELLENNVIIDFSLLRTIGVSKADLQFLLNIILYNIQTEATLRKRSRELKNMIVIEDAEHLIPNLFRKKTTADTLIAEDFAMLMGALQIGLISVSTRPIISENILANSGTKIFFRTTFDHEKAAKFLNLNLKQKNYLRVMQKREAFCVIPDFPYPFLIKTREFNKNHVSNFAFSLAALDPFTIKSRLSYNPLSTPSPISRSLPKNNLKTEKTNFSFKDLHPIFSQCKNYCLFSFWTKEHCYNSIISILPIVDDYIKDKNNEELRLKLNDNPLFIYQELSKKAGNSHTINWTKGLCAFSVLLNKLSSEYPEINPLIPSWLNTAKNYSNTKINDEIKTFYAQLTKDRRGE
ncbi:MAG: ATP-binding protein [Candidatus Hodarchaeota archaeon]